MLAAGDDFIFKSGDEDAKRTNCYSSDSIRNISIHRYEVVVVVVVVVIVLKIIIYCY